MAAYNHYLSNDYDAAILSGQRFLALHPGNEHAPYANYLIALCYYEQISDVSRDQKATENALFAFRELVRRYPGSEYAKDSQLKIELTMDHLAGKEMTIGRFYSKNREYMAAINRFQVVIKEYPTTSQVPEALHRLTEAFLAMGIVAEATKAAAVLGYNYPDSEWYAFSYELLSDKGVALTGG
jgi:outer membrane protein assembly factor BamD